MIPFITCPPVDERADLERRMREHVELITQEHVALLRAMASPDQHLANVRGALLGVAICAVGQGIEEGWINGIDATVDALNTILAQRGLAWRFIRPH